MTVKNISRPRALDLVPEKDSCWVSIQEPSNEHITCELDKLPNLKIKFWDIVIPITDVRTKEIIPPLQNKMLRILWISYYHIPIKTLLSIVSWDIRDQQQFQNFAVMF